MFAFHQYIALHQSTAVGRCAGFQLRLVDDTFGLDLQYVWTDSQVCGPLSLGTRFRQCKVASDAVVASNAVSALMRTAFDT